MSPIKKFDTELIFSSTDVIARNFLNKISANGRTPQIERALTASHAQERSAFWAGRLLAVQVSC